MRIIIIIIMKMTNFQKIMIRTQAKFNKPKKKKKKKKKKIIMNQVHSLFLACLLIFL